MTAGPVVAALAAEAPPADQRGRYMAATQLAWSASGAVGRCCSPGLLDQERLPLWGARSCCACSGRAPCGARRGDAARARAGHQRAEPGRRPALERRRPDEVGVD